MQFVLPHCPHLRRRVDVLWERIHARGQRFIHRIRDL